MPTAEIITHLSRDPVLARIIPVCRLEIPEPNSLSLFEYLSQVIIYQQLSGKAADTIHGRFLALFGEKPLSPRHLLELEHETLRSAGLSNQKARYLKHIAQYFLASEQSEALRDWEDEALIRELTSIKGIGSWTAKITLLSWFQRPDIFPVEDLTIRQTIRELYDLEEEGKELISRIEMIASAWSPYRSYACRYLWAWVDRRKK